MTRRGRTVAVLRLIVENRGNALLEIALVPLLLLPIAALIVRAWGIQQSQLSLSDVARTLGRASAVAPHSSPEQYRVLARVMLEDAGLLETTEVLMRSEGGTQIIVLRRRVDSLAPGLSSVVERTVRVE